MDSPVILEARNHKLAYFTIVITRSGKLQGLLETALIV